MLSNATKDLVTDGLRTLLKAEDADRFFQLPILEPEHDYFPDAWSPDQDGVHRLLRRIMFYAGLGEMPVSIERFVFNEDDDDAGGAGERHVVAFFRGVENGVCTFGINCAALDVPERLIGILAHEVAHAYRAINELVVEDHDEEEELTDLTTIFLGFGVFTTNNAQQVSTFNNTTQTRRAGYLSAHAMTFALAAWVSARGEKSDRLVIERWLEPTQRALFADTLPRLHAEKIRVALGVTKIDAIRRANGKMRSDAPAAAKDAEPIDFSAARSDTFRVLFRPQRLGLSFGPMLGAVIATTVIVMPATWIIAVSAVLGGAAGWLVGRLMAYDSCARLECEKRIPPRAARCPRCGAVVQGEIKNREMLYDALEDLRKRRVRERRARLNATNEANGA